MGVASSFCLNLHFRQAFLYTFYLLLCKVALVSLAGYELYIQAPDAKFSHAVVMYRILTPPYIPNPPIHIPGLNFGFII